MFICDDCQQVSKPGDSIYFVVTEKRDKTYFYTSIEVGRNKEKKLIERTREDEPVNKTTKGWEIVRERKVCEKCFDLKYNYDTSKEVLVERPQKNQESIKVNRTNLETKS